MTESFYDLLGVSADADVDEIQRAYRRRIKETHPDVNDDPDASERTAQLVEARDVLTDEAERARYDRVGHDAYVDADGSPDSWSSEAAETVGSSSSDGPTNARAGAEERRRRERRARRDVDFGDGSKDVGPDDATATSAGSTATSSGSTSTSTGHAATSSGATADGTSTGSRGTGGGGRASTTATRGPPPWNDSSQGWAARSPTSPPPGLVAQTKAAVLQAPATAIIIFLLYPLLVFGTFLPAFPLAVNFVVCVCLLAMIAAAQSVAGLGVAVFGAWTALATVGLVAAGVSPFSPLGFVVLGTSWLPLGFSVLTYNVLDT